jgi:hypothetical protein
MWAEKRPHEWLGGVLGVLGLAPSTHISQIKQKVLKGYDAELENSVLTARKYRAKRQSNLLTKNIQKSLKS